MPTIAKDEYVLVFQTKDGERVAFPCTKDLSQGGYCILARTADGEKVPVSVQPMRSLNELGILAQTYDGEMVPMVFGIASGLRPSFFSPGGFIRNSFFYGQNNCLVAVGDEENRSSYQNNPTGFARITGLIPFGYRESSTEVFLDPFGFIPPQLEPRIEYIDLRPIFHDLSGQQWQGSVIAVGCSDDGKYITACGVINFGNHPSGFVDENGQKKLVFTRSTDGGENWSALTDSGVVIGFNNNFRKIHGNVVMSTDGKYQYIVGALDIAKSSNFGQSWSFGGQTLSGRIWCSKNGQIVVKSSWDNDPGYISFNAGSTYSGNLPVEANSFREIVADQSGKIILAVPRFSISFFGAAEEKIYKSEDGGLTWRLVLDSEILRNILFPINQFTPLFGIYAISASDDLKHVYVQVIIGDHQLIVSDDYGENWYAMHIYNQEKPFRSGERALLGSNQNCSRDGKFFNLLIFSRHYFSDNFGFFNAQKAQQDGASIET
jgi:hypothetical protein